MHRAQSRQARSGEVAPSDGADVTLSFLERGFLALLDDYGLPRPRTNIDRQGDKVDCYWEEFDLTVELVSFRYHATRYGFDTDVARRRRSNHLAFSYGDVFESPAATAAELAVLLSLPRAHPSAG